MNLPSRSKGARRTSHDPLPANRPRNRGNARCPDLADVFAGREADEGLGSAGEVVGVRGRRRGGCAADRGWRDGSASRPAVADPPDRLRASPSLIVRLVRSIRPSVQGWFGLVGRCSIPLDRRPRTVAGGARTDGASAGDRTWSRRRGSCRSERGAMPSRRGQRSTGPLPDPSSPRTAPWANGVPSSATPSSPPRSSRGCSTTATSSPSGATAIASGKTSQRAFAKARRDTQNRHRDKLRVDPFSMSPPDQFRMALDSWRWAAPAGT